MAQSVLVYGVVYLLLGDAIVLHYYLACPAAEGQANLCYGRMKAVKELRHWVGILNVKVYCDWMLVHSVWF